MLHIIREQIQGWIAWTIIILLIIPFALWGINQYFGHGGAPVAATVNGEKISQREFQQRYTAQRDRMRQMLGAQYKPSVFEPRIKKQVLQNLINEQLLMQNADEVGYRVSMDSVKQTILSINAFKKDGKFSNELYVRALQSQGETPASFEYRLQQAVLSQQLQKGVSTSAFVTQSETDRLLKLQNQTRDVDHLLLKLDSFKDQADATDEAIKKYYEQHRAQFMTPEKVSLEYVELNTADLGKDAKPTDEELKQMYKDRKSQFQVPEERRSSHILISVKEGADEATIKKAREKANDIRKQLLAGADFAKLAKKYSDDPGSSKLGGDIGFFGQGNLDPAYEKALFSLKVGEISKPVLSAFGFHIIKLEEIRAGKTKSFDEVKNELIADYRKKVADREYFDKSDKLTRLAYEVPTTLADAAGAVGLEIKTTPLFGRKGGPGIAANPKVIQAAFSNDVLVQGYNSDAIELGDNHVVVIRVKDHVKKSQQSLEDVKAQVKSLLITEDARKKVRLKGEETLKRLQSGEDPQDVAKELGTTWIKSGELKRDDRKIDSAIVSQAFKLSRPETGKASYGGATLANGNYALIAVNKVTNGDAAKIEKPKKMDLQKTLAGIRGSDEFDDVLATLKASAEVKIEDTSVQ